MNKNMRIQDKIAHVENRKHTNITIQELIERFRLDGIKIEKDANPMADDWVCLTFENGYEVLLWLGHGAVVVHPEVQ